MTYRELKSEHRCASCGKQDRRTLAGMTYCDGCAQKNRENQRRWLSNPENVERKKELERARRERLKADGLCPRCGKPAEEGYVTCRECLDSEKQDRAWYIQHNVCPKCGKQDSFTLSGRVLCADCADRASQKQRERLSTPEARKADSMKVMSYQNRLRENRLCLRCRKPLEPDTKYVRCPICRAISRNKREPTWIDPDLCHACHKAPPIEGKKVCQACYERLCRNAAHARQSINREKHPWRKDEDVRLKELEGRQ